MISSEDTTIELISDNDGDNLLFLNRGQGRRYSIDNKNSSRKLRRLTGSRALDKDELFKNTSPQIERISADRLLTCLSLAIEETKQIISIIKSRDMARKLNKNNPFSDRLTYLNREITYLVAKLTQVRNTSNRF